MHRVVIGDQHRQSRALIPQKPPFWGGGKVTTPCLRQHQAHAETGSDAGRAGNGQLSTKNLRQKLSDRQAKPDPVDRRGVRLFDTLERFEDPLEVGFGNTDFGVLDHDLGDFASPAQAEMDLAGAGELHSVGEQVDQDLSQPPFVSIYDSRDAIGPCKGKSDAFCLGLQAEHAHQLTQKLLDRHRIAIDLDAPCLNFRDVQQALDQPGEMLAAAPDDADAVVPSSTDRVVPLQQLRVTEDGVQRTAQFMADADHIAAFREICRLRRLLGFL